MAILIIQFQASTVVILIIRFQANTVAVLTIHFQASKVAILTTQLHGTDLPIQMWASDCTFAEDSRILEGALCIGRVIPDVSNDRSAFETLESTHTIRQRHISEN